MKMFLARSLVFTIALSSILFSGCGRSDPAPPPPLAAEQIVPEMRKVFTKAKADVSEAIAKIDTGLGQKDYTSAYQAVQFLCNLPQATTEQRSVSVRASLTIFGLMQTASTQGDQNSAAMIDYIKRNR